MNTQAMRAGLGFTKGGYLGVGILSELSVQRSAWAYKRTATSTITIASYFRVNMSFLPLTPPFDNGCIRPYIKAASTASRVIKGARVTAARAHIPSGWDVTMFDFCISVVSGMLKLKKWRWRADLWGSSVALNLAYDPLSHWWFDFFTWRNIRM